jgi:hypothetical protein
MILTVLFAAAISAGGTLHQDVPVTPQDGGVVVTGERNKANKRICKRAVATGSVMQKVTCRTAAEWNAATDKSIATLERLRGDDRWREAGFNEKDLLPKEGAPR